MKCNIIVKCEILL